MENRWEKYAYLLGTAGIWTYLVLRAIQVPLVNDESETFLHYIQSSHFIPWHTTHWIANNHFLNTALSWLSYQVFGLNEWVLRLPSLLSFLLFAGFLYRIGQTIRSRPLRWFLWLTLFSTHYLVEFFAYCRGYAMSYAFLLGALYYLLEFARDTSRYRDPLKWSLLCITAALFANLNLLFCFLTWMLAVYVIHYQKRGSWKPNKWLVVSLFPLAYSISIVFQLKIRDQFYIGTDLGMESSLKTLLGIMFPIHLHGITYFVYFLAVCILAGFILHLYKARRAWLPSPLGLFFLFLFLNLLAAYLAYALLGMKLPVARTILHWYLLFSITLLLTLDVIVRKPGGWVAYLIVIPLLYIPYRFSESMNLHVSSDPNWASEHIQDDFYHYMARVPEVQGFLPTLAAGLNFYKHNWALIHLQKHRDVNICQSYVAPEFIADYQIVDLEKAPVFKEYYQEMLYDTYSGMSLVRRHNFLERIPLVQLQAEPFRDQAHGFYSLFAVDTAVWAGQALQLDYTLRLTRDQPFFGGLITVMLKDTGNAVIGYYQMSLNQLRADWRKNQPLRCSLYINSVPLEAVRMESYLWNFYGQTYTLDKAEVTVHQLKE